jgi:hypothetical protein
VDILKQKINTAHHIVLRKPNKQLLINDCINLQKIDVYNFNTGIKLDVVKIKTTVKFKEMEVYQEEGKVVCTSSRENLHKEVAGQFLIFTIPPLKFKSHLQTCGCGYK